MEIDDKVREREKVVRRTIMRTALWSTPLFVTLGGLWVFFLWDRITGPEYGSTWFLMVVITLFGALFGVQSIAALRDLFGKPLEESGRVLRKWTKRDSFVWKSFYIRIGKRILRGDDDVLQGIESGDLIEVRFFAHSSLIISARLLETAKPEPEKEEEPELVVPAAPARPRGTASRPEF